VSFSVSEFNWQLILIIVAISAVVSYVGDVLGMRIGKKRISLFGLRPRYTSTVITTFTGVAVAILTLFAASYTSESVRAAFFGVSYLEREIARLIQDQRERQDQLDRLEFDLSMAHSDLGAMEKELTSASDDLRNAESQLALTRRQASNLEKERSDLSRQVKELNAEKRGMESAVANLRGETEQLKKGLAEMKEGRVIAFQGELLAQTPVEGGASSADIDGALATLIRIAEETLAVKNRESGILKASETLPKAAITSSDRERIHKELGSAKGRKLLRFMAPSNVVQGQVLNGAVEILGSRLVFRKDDVLMTETVESGFSQSRAADELYAMLRRINRKAVAQGVLPDPISGMVGNLDTLDFYDVVDRISEAGSDSVVTFLAANDIYTEGPVNVKIVLGDGY
jgi:uncharacterized protein (DUF3084 family)